MFLAVLNQKLPRRALTGLRSKRVPPMRSYIWSKWAVSFFGRTRKKRKQFDQIFNFLSMNYICTLLCADWSPRRWILPAAPGLNKNYNRKISWSMPNFLKFFSSELVKPFHIDNPWCIIQMAYLVQYSRPCIL